MHCKPHAQLWSAWDVVLHHQNRNAVLTESKNLQSLQKFFAGKVELSSALKVKIETTWGKKNKTKTTKKCQLSKMSLCIMYSLLINI